MKITRMYKESTNIEDLSKDRIKLDLSWNEWNKLRNFIDFVEWKLPRNSRLQKKANNLNNCLKHAQETQPEWY